jgi:16S rRNA processing protein RimM
MARPTPADRQELSVSAATPHADEWLVVARVAAPHGVRGDLRCEIVTDFPERFRRMREVFLGPGRVRYEVERVGSARGQLTLKLVGVETRMGAEGLRGQLLCVPEKDAVKLPRGSYFWHQIIGLSVQTEDGRDLGQVGEIIETGSNDVYVVRDGGTEHLIPAIKDVVLDIDLGAGLMTVRLLEGLD